MSAGDNYILRPLMADDVPRIFSDWLRSYRAEKELRNVPNPVFFHWHHRLVESLLVDPTAAWLVAVDPESPTMIAGWACAQEFANGKLLVHYLYVAKNLRRLGLASRLLASLGVPKDEPLMVTARTFAGEAVLRSRGNLGVYNPYLLMGRAPVSVVVESRKEIMEAIKKSAKAFRNGYPRNDNTVPEE